MIIESTHTTPSLELTNMPPFFDIVPEILEFILEEGSVYMTNLPDILDSTENFDAIKISQADLGTTFVSKTEKNETSDQILYDFDLNKVTLEL